MSKKRKVSQKKVRKLVVGLVAILALLVVIFGLYQLIFAKKNKQEVKVEDKLEAYGYELNDNESNYYKDLFKELKKTLTEDTVEEKTYASLLSQMFVADFFHLDNKLSKNDIGGTQFVYESYQKDFEKYAKEGIYHYVENNIYGNRKQELPVVTAVTVVDIQTREYDYLDQSDEKAYFVDLEITYEKDLEYQKEVSLVLIHHGKKLEIVKMS